MKRFLSFVFCAFTASVLSAQKVVIVDKPGQLSEKILAEEKFSITDLSVSGPINGDDVILLREMSGIDIDNNETAGKLERLDLHSADIVKGGEPYYTDYSTVTDYYTSDNEVGDMMFCNCKSLKSIVMPDGAVVIGRAAFKGCLNLAVVTLPQAVAEIRSEAFSGTSLTEFSFPDNVMPSERVFAGCSKLSKVTLPALCTEIPYSAFSGTAIEKISFPSSLKVIGENAFSGSRLVEVTFPENLETIGKTAFMLCGDLAEVHFNEKLDSIGESAFSNCGSITSLDIPESVTKIGKSAFAVCGKLTEVRLPDGLTEISGGMFDRCYSLSSINVPSRLEKIGELAFQNNSDLEDFKFPETIREIGESSFNNAGLLEIVLPDGLTELGVGAFSGCEYATKIVLPKTVTKIADEAFSYCSSVEELVIEDGVSEIGGRAFLMCYELKKLTLPSSLKTVGQMAFAGLDVLEELHCRAVTPPSLGSSAFLCDEGDVPVNCTLYVPEGSKNAYSTADTWKEFFKIEEETSTGIGNLEGNTDKREVMRLDSSGQRISAPCRGLNIVVYSDGTTKKEMIGK